jgi:hypothetical protein
MFETESKIEVLIKNLSEEEFLDNESSVLTSALIEIINLSEKDFDKLLYAKRRELDLNYNLKFLIGKNLLLISDHFEKLDNNQICSLVILSDFFTSSHELKDLCFSRKLDLREFEKYDLVLGERFPDYKYTDLIKFLNVFNNLTDLTSDELVLFSFGDRSQPDPLKRSFSKKWFDKQDAKYDGNFTSKIKFTPFITDAVRTAFDGHNCYIVRHEEKKLTLPGKPTDKICHADSRSCVLVTFEDDGSDTLQGLISFEPVYNNTGLMITQIQSLSGSKLHNFMDFGNFCIKLIYKAALDSGYTMLILQSAKNNPWVRIQNDDGSIHANLTQLEKIYDRLANNMKSNLRSGFIENKNGDFITILRDDYNPSYPQI